MGCLSLFTDNDNRYIDEIGGMIMGMWNEVLNVVWRLVNVVLAAMVGEILLPWMKQQLIPWLKERHLQRVVAVFVQAAEKLAESGQIDKTDKHDYVVAMLRSKSIEITPEIDAFIESAVVDLDKTLNNSWKSIVAALTAEDQEAPKPVED